MTNCSFLANTALNGDGGAAFNIQNKVAVTVTNCYAVANVGVSNAGGFRIDSSEVTVINSTFAESQSSADVYAITGELSRFAAYGSVFKDTSLLSGGSVIVVNDGARGSMTDCRMIRGVAVTSGSAAMSVSGGGTMSILRTTFLDNRALSQSSRGGCFELYDSGTLAIDDSDISGCWCGGDNGMAYVGSGVSVVISRSRMYGNGAAGNGLVTLEGSGPSLRISDSTLTDTSSGDGEFAIAVVDANAPDFSLQLDTVDVDGTVDIFSHSKVLVQNCKGLNSTAVRNASVGTCQSTTDHCLAESCTDARIGIECFCDIDGVPNPFPTDCMQSAVIEARR